MESRDNWSRRIRTATTTAAVLEILGGFLGSIAPNDMERLPREVRVELRRIHYDVHAVALEVLREDLRHASDEAGVETLHRLALTFADASERLAQIEREDA
jgi:hypothetical protein